MAIQDIEVREEIGKKFLQLYADSSADVTDLPTSGVCTGSYCIVNGDGIYIFDDSAWTKVTVS